MTDSEKPKGDLKNAEGVSVDSEGNPKVGMEALEKGGGGAKDEKFFQITDDDEE